MTAWEQRWAPPPKDLSPLLQCGAAVENRCLPGAPSGRQTTVLCVSSVSDPFGSRYVFSTLSTLPQGPKDGRAEMEGAEHSHWVVGGVKNNLLLGEAPKICVSVTVLISIPRTL